MGFLDKVKEKQQEFSANKAEKAADKRWAYDHYRWKADFDHNSEMVQIISNLAQGINSVNSAVALKKGEVTLWTADAVMHELRKTPGQYVGRSRGVSIPISGTRMRVRVGASKGSFAPGPETQTIIASGMVLLTNQRIIFAGGSATKEWSFSKWIGADTNSSATDYLFHVSNRQKASGIRFNDGEQGEMFNQLLGIVLTYQEDSAKEALEEFQNELDVLKGSEPKRENY